MSNSHKNQDPAPKPDKKPYLKPAFRSEKVFETMALACGKIRQTEPQCAFNKKKS